MPRATKLRRIVQKVCRYTLIAKNPFRLSVPMVRFLLATLTYTYKCSTVSINMCMYLKADQCMVQCVGVSAESL